MFSRLWVGCVNTGRTWCPFLFVSSLVKTQSSLSLTNQCCSRAEVRIRMCHCPVLIISESFYLFCWISGKLFLFILPDHHVFTPNSSECHIFLSHLRSVTGQRNVCTTGFLFVAPFPFALNRELEEPERLLNVNEVHVLRRGLGWAAFVPFMVEGKMQSHGCFSGGGKQSNSMLL